MSASTAIGMVSTSLRNLLLGELSISPVVPVTILAPDEMGGERRINLFLYNIHENVNLRNSDWQVSSSDQSKIVPPPLSLNLFYLMTAYATNDAQNGNSAAHEILGDAMRVFYENAIIPQKYLVTGLKNTNEKIKITHNSLDLDELSKVWSTFTKPFRLSILYEVSVVQLDASEKKERMMAKRVRKIGAPLIAAQYLPPTVDSITPSSGPAGVLITFSGSNFAQWTVRASIAGHALTCETGAGVNTFTATIPLGLKPGFYELGIEISSLFKRMFLFEVTP